VTNKIDIRVIEDVSSLLENREQWSTVVSTSEYRLHTSVAYVRAWLETFGKDRSFACVLMLNSGKPIAAIPLIFASKWIGPVKFRYGRLLSNDFSPRSGLTIVSHHQQVYAELAALLHRRRICWIQVGWISSKISGPILDGLRQHGWDGYRQQRVDLPILRFDSNWEQWLAGKSRTFRKSLRAAASRSTSYSCESFLGRSTDVARLIELVEFVDRCSWSHQSGSSFVGSELQKKFVRGLIREFAQTGNVIASVMIDENGEAAAFAFGFNVVGRVYGFKTGYRQELHDASLGTHVMAKFAQLCVESGADSLDMDCITTHSEYKKRWCNDIEHTESWHLFGPGRRGRIVRRAYLTRKWLRK
jgi:CelD/BcsL family acetyltransferase involved in cellulose biosynthesis